MNWEEAKKQIDKMDFPSDSDGWTEKDLDEQHTKKRKVHHMVTSKKYLDPIGDYEIEAKYNYCKECGEVRNKKIMMFDNEEGVCYEKWFKWHGKDTEGKDYSKLVASVFGAIVLLLMN